MELIPILSTIILVATISTLLLAIGAYILYKVRERKGEQAAVVKPATVQAELVTPSARKQGTGRSLYSEPQGQQYKQPAPQPIFFQQNHSILSTKQPRVSPSYQSTNSAQNQPKQFTGSTQPRGYQGPGYATQGQGGQSEKKVKFQQYTSDGYVAAKKDDKNSGALKWR